MFEFRNVLDLHPRLFNKHRTEVKREIMNETNGMNIFNLRNSYNCSCCTKRLEDFFGHFLKQFFLLFHHAE